MSETTKRIEINKIYNEDCLDTLSKMSNDTVDCIWTDPPYNIGYNYKGYNDKRNDYFEFMEIVINESYRVLKNDGNIFMKMWSKYVFDFGDIFKKAGFIHKNNIIWKRKSCANYKDKFLGGYEIIFFFSKTNKNKWNPTGFLRKTQFLKRWDGKKEYKGRLNDLWDDIRPITAGNLIHPEGIYIEGTGKKKHSAQHPEELVTRCISCGTDIDDLVYDPFMGSGTTAVSCVNLNRKYIGSEISEEYCEIARRRINE